MKGRYENNYKTTSNESMSKPQQKSSGLSERVPAYRGKEGKRNVGNGIVPRQPSYRGKHVKAGGVSQSAAYTKRGGNLMK